MKNTLPKDIQKKMEVAESALEVQDGPPSGRAALEDRQKLADRATYHADQFPLSKMGVSEAMQDYNNCKKTDLGDGMVVATGTLGVYKKASSEVAFVPGPASIGYIVQETAKAFDKSLNHVIDHNHECSVKETLAQPDPTAYSFSKLCEETQRLAAEKPFVPPPVLVLPVDIPPLKQSYEPNPAIETTVVSELPAERHLDGLESKPSEKVEESQENRHAKLFTPSFSQQQAEPPPPQPQPQPAPAAPAIQPQVYAQTNGRRHRIGIRIGF